MLRSSLPRVAVSLAALFAGLGLAHAEDKRPPKEPVLPAPSADVCALASGSVRMEAYGYTHVVTLKNGCTRTVECALWTDVDPEPRTTVTATPGRSAEIITRRGSPAREVTAFKTCRFK